MVLTIIALLRSPPTSTSLPSLCCLSLSFLSHKMGWYCSAHSHWVGSQLVAGKRRIIHVSPQKAPAPVLQTSGSSQTPNLHPISSIPQLLMGWKGFQDLPFSFIGSPTQPEGHQNRIHCWKAYPRADCLHTTSTQAWSRHSGRMFRPGSGPRRCRPPCPPGASAGLI